MGLPQSAHGAPIERQRFLMLSRAHPLALRLFVFAMCQPPETAKGPEVSKLRAFSDENTNSNFAEKGITLSTWNLQTLRATLPSYRLQSLPLLLPSSSLLLFRLCEYIPSAGRLLCFPALIARLGFDAMQQCASSGLRACRDTLGTSPCALLSSRQLGHP